MKTNSRKKEILFALAVGLLTAGTWIGLQTHGLSALNVPELFVGTPVSSTTVVGTGVSYEAPGKPVRLIIPSIGVDANVQSVGLSWHGNGDMGVPTNFTDVGWYKDGPMPGMPGSAVIDGHLDGRNVPQAVFYNLGKLQKGDAVEVVDKQGKHLQFRVVDVKSYDYNASTTEVFAGDPSKIALNLITCAGDWNKAEKIYSKRVVVFTEMVQG